MDVPQHCKKKFLVYFFDARPLYISKMHLRLRQTLDLIPVYQVYTYRKGNLVVGFTFSSATDGTGFEIQN